MSEGVVFTGLVAWAVLLILFTVWLLHLARKAVDRQDAHNRRMEELWSDHNQPDHDHEDRP